MPVTRGEDSGGPFYRWGTHGHRYRYQTQAGRARAKARAGRQGRAVESRRGGGDRRLTRPRRRRTGGNVGDNVAGFFSGPRAHASPAVRAFLEQHGAEPVLGLEVFRTPLSGKIEIAFQLITLGAWGRAKKSVGYDNLFHLGLVVTTPSGRYVLEKNHVVQFTAPYDVGAGARMPVATPPNTTLAQLLERGEAYQGAGTFWLYDPWRNNCQVFVMSMLSGNGVNTPELSAFVLQGMDQLLAGLRTSAPGSFGERFAQGVTNLAGRFDRLLYGSGVSYDELFART